MFDFDKASKFLGRLNIRDRDSGQMVPFILNPNQRKAVELIKEKQVAKGRPVRYLCLKARRVGMSSLTDGLGVVYCLANAGTDARIVAHLQDSVDLIFKVPSDLTKGLRKYLPEIPEPTQDTIIIPHPSGPSQFTIATAGSTAGGRGGGFFFLHLSEVAYYKSPEAFTSLLNTVPDHPNTFICIESTANGRVGLGEEFYKRWKAAEQGDSEYIPVFLSWLDDPACIRPAEELKGELDSNEKELVKYFGASPQQLAWRRYTIASKCNHYIERFLQEYPHSADVAFIASGNPAFTTEEMSIARASVEPPKWRLIIRKKGGSNDPIIEVSDRAPLKVWEKPVRAGDKFTAPDGSEAIATDKHWYYIGADAARGQVEGDFAAITVINGTTDAVVARYEEQINPEALAYLLDTLGRWYNNALVNVELTGNLGLWCVTRLRDNYRYPNLYRRPSGKDDKAPGRPKSGNILGWETTPKSREIAFTYFREALREFDLQVRDEVVAAQMDLAQRALPGERWEIKKGHDDALFSCLLANVARHQFPPPNMLRHKKPVDDTPEEQQIPFKVQYEPGDRIHARFLAMKNSVKKKKDEGRLYGI